MLSGQDRIKRRCSLDKYIEVTPAFTYPNQSVLERFSIESSKFLKFSNSKEFSHYLFNPLLIHYHSNSFKKIFESTSLFA